MPCGNAKLFILSNCLLLYYFIIYYIILLKQIMVCSRTPLLTATNAPNMSTLVLPT